MKPVVEVTVKKTTVVIRETVVGGKWIFREEVRREVVVSKK